MMPPQEYDGLEWEPPQALDGRGCLTALALTAVIWTALIYAGVYVWRHL